MTTKTAPTESHSPSPWAERDGVIVSVPLDVVVSVNDADSTRPHHIGLVAIVYGHHLGPDPKGLRSYSLDGNKRLITAAPEMLALLRKYHDAMESWELNTVSDDDALDRLSDLTAETEALFARVEATSPPIVELPPVCPSVPKHPYGPWDCLTGWRADGVIHDCKLRRGHEDACECYCGRSQADGEDAA